MWIRVPVHCQCRGHCPLRQPCHRAKVGCQSRCQCVAAVTVPRERDERCPRGLCLPVGYCASTPGYPNSGIPAGIRNQESDSGMGPTRSRFLIPVPSQAAAGVQPQLDGTPECRHIRHSELPKGCPEQACVTRFAASSCLVDLPAASIPIGLRKDPCSDSAGRKHARLSCLSVESVLHVPEGKLCRRARGGADCKAV